GQRPRQPGLADLRLCAADLVLDAAEARRARLEVEEEPRGLRVAVARLADRPGGQEPAAPVHVPLAASRREPAAALLLHGERDVAVPDEEERLGGRVEARPDRLGAQHVVPDRVERAAVEQPDSGALALGGEAADERAR